MTASQPSPGTTSRSVPRSSARALAAVAVLLACLAGIAPTALASEASGTLTGVVAFAPPPAALAASGPPPALAPPAAQPAAHAAPAAKQPVAHAARGCPSAPRVLRGSRDIVRTQRRMLCLMNHARARAGLAPLHPNRCLHRVAARHAHDMVNRRYFAHTTPNGWDPGRRARASGYVPRAASWIVGENIAWGVAGAATAGWVFNAWMHSPPHRHNILGRQFRDVGIGVAPGVPARGFRGIAMRATFSVEFGAHRGRTRCG
ncbi:MAG TPA: CAP domain-containing protein [Conexibacter sp.]|nr:CAP domain-containing protein [Conexibacter sp.]